MRYLCKICNDRVVSHYLLLSRSSWKKYLEPATSSLQTKNSKSNGENELKRAHCGDLSARGKDCVEDCTDDAENGEGKIKVSFLNEFQGDTGEALRDPFMDTTSSIFGLKGNLHNIIQVDLDDERTSYDGEYTVILKPKSNLSRCSTPAFSRSPFSSVQITFAVYQPSSSSVFLYRVTWDVTCIPERIR